jgi:hypothetical protein
MPSYRCEGAKSHQPYAPSSAWIQPGYGITIQKATAMDEHITWLQMRSSHNHVFAQCEVMNVDSAKGHGCDYATIIHQTSQAAKLVSPL